LVQRLLVVYAFFTVAFHAFNHLENGVWQLSTNFFDSSYAHRALDVWLYAFNHLQDGGWLIWGIEIEKSISGGVNKIITNCRDSGGCEVEKYEHFGYEHVDIYILHELFANGTNVLAQCGREHHHLFAVRRATENLLNVTTHI